jgi:hypothetical protein
VVRKTRPGEMCITAARLSGSTSRSAIIVGKWVGETYRRQPMIVPTVIEI